MIQVEPDERGDWWNFERLSRCDPTHPAAAWVGYLLQDAALLQRPCPRCGQVASMRTNLDHLLRDHKASYAEAATWLEEADADLFSLAIHYLATKARSSRPDSGAPEITPARRPRPCSPSIGAERARAPGLLPGWCRRPTPC